MKRDDHANPPPPDDDAFSRMLESALNDGDLSLTKDRRAAVLNTFAEMAGAGAGKSRSVAPIAWWVAAGAAACLVLWLTGAFNAALEPGRDEVTQTGSSQQALAGEQLARANLRLAVLSDQLARAEQQLVWLQARGEKIPEN